MAAAGFDWANDRKRLGLGELSAPSSRAGGEEAEKQAGQEQQTTGLWLSVMAYAGAAMVASGRAEWAVGQLVAGQRRGTVRVVGGAALVRRCKKIT